MRRDILPQLHSYPFVNIWQAGCATGEEAYSLAVMLDQEGLLDRAQIYATDINDAALRKAEEGIYSAKRLPEFERNYEMTGGKTALSGYYVKGYDFIRFIDRLREHIVFAHHNLVSDGVFCEFQVILCRNVLIYFNRDLQERVIGLFNDSLARGGYLCLGTREILRFSRASQHFTAVNADLRIFRHVGEAA